MEGVSILKLLKKKIELLKSLFEQNTALSSGGALYFENIFECEIKFDILTKIKNNVASIGGGLRIVQNDQNPLQLPNDFPFFDNVYQNEADIYGDNSASYLQNINIRQGDMLNGFMIFYENLGSMPNNYKNDYQRYVEVREFRSGGFLNFKVFLLDHYNRKLSFQIDKLMNGGYPSDIEKELNNIQISISGLQSNITLVNGQQIINYQQYNFKEQAFVFDDLQIIGSANQIRFFSITSTIHANSVNKQPILLSIQFRNCKIGEVIQQINELIYFCKQCIEGTYQLIEPKTLYEKSLRERSDINRCINCPQSAIRCEGNQIQLKNGFWRQNNNTDEIIICNPHINSCQAQNPKSINYCVTGYLGPICEQCDILGEVWKGSRYSESLLKGVCKECDSKLNQWIYFILKIILFELYTIQTLGVFIKKFNHSLTCFYLRRLKILPISSNSISDYSGFFIKIILNYYQLSQLIIQQPRIIPINLNFFSDLFGSGSRSIQLGFDCLVNESIIRQLSKTFFYTLFQFSTPLIAIAFIPVAAKFYECYSKTKLRKYHLQLLFHVIFVYFQISQISYFTKALTCKQVGNHSYNPIDLSIDCQDSSIFKYLYPFSIIVLSFWTLFPLVFLRLIRKNQKHLDECLIKYKYGYYYGELKNQYYYWEFVRIYLKIAVVYLYTLLYNNNQYLAILAITILFLIYIKIISQKNPFISIQILKCEITAYTLILLKLFLLVMQIYNPQFQRYIEIAQICLDYYFFLSCLVIVLGIVLGNSTSRCLIFIKNQLLKVIPSKSFKKFLKFNKVEFKTYKLWRLVYRKFSKSQKQLQIIKKKNNMKKLEFTRNVGKNQRDSKIVSGLSSFQKFI